MRTALSLICIYIMVNQVVPPDIPNAVAYLLEILFALWILGAMACDVRASYLIFINKN